MTKDKKELNFVDTWALISILLSLIAFIIIITIIYMIVPNPTDYLFEEEIGAIRILAVFIGLAIVIKAAKGKQNVEISFTRENHTLQGPIQILIYAGMFYGFLYLFDNVEIGLAKSTMAFTYIAACVFLITRLFNLANAQKIVVRSAKELDYAVKQVKDKLID